jgi:hypothetical protein
VLKNLIVILPTELPDNTTIQYPISLARTSDAHLAADAFAYEDIPGAEEAAKAKVAKFEDNDMRLWNLDLSTLDDCKLLPNGRAI